MTRCFRIQTPYQEDTGKTIIRIEKTEMQELGIEKGDMVKITGGRTTYAFCIPLDADHDTQDEKNFVYLDEPSKYVPIVKASDLVYSNLRIQFGSLVKISKAETVIAKKMTVNPAGEDRNNFTLDWLEGQLVVCKGDRIIGKHDDPMKCPLFFVLDATPQTEAWVIDKNTPIEISDKFPRDFHGTNVAGGSLNQVIPLVQKIKGEDFDATLSAIEVYDDCMRLWVYITDSIVGQEQRTSGLCNPSIKIWDDLGNQYVTSNFGARGGGTQFGGAVWGSTDHNNFSEISIMMTPTLDVKAQELTISVEQLLWDIRKHPRPPLIAKSTDEIPIMMTPFRLEEKFAIHSGPWQFKIKLKEK